VLDSSSDSSPDSLSSSDSESSSSEEEKSHKSSKKRKSRDKYRDYRPDSRSYYRSNSKAHRRHYESDIQSQVESNSGARGFHNFGQSYGFPPPRGHAGLSPSPIATMQAQMQAQMDEMQAQLAAYTQPKSYDSSSRGKIEMIRACRAKTSAANTESNSKSRQQMTSESMTNPNEHIPLDETIEDSLILHPPEFSGGDWDVEDDDELGQGEEQDDLTSVADESSRCQ
jgi:hypothetical protein